MPKSILSVSYDVSLLATRQWLLEQRGYTVISALGFTKAVECCQQSDFDLFILGHSIAQQDKLALIDSFRRSCPAPILSLERHGEDHVPADYYASPDDPERFVKIVDGILAEREL